MSLLICLTAAALVITACSSTTVVARDDRPSEAEQTDSASEPDSAASDVDDQSDDEPTEDESAAGDEQVPADDGDEPEADRGAREGATDEPTTPRELEEAEGFGLGGAEQLDGLLSDCESGSDMACDILFELSGFDSPEETAALSCGGRSETITVFCTEGITAMADELVFDVESEGLAVIVAECEGGDMTACDFLYFRSPFESEIEEIGATCGGRVQVAVPDCRTFIG